MLNGKTVLLGITGGIAAYKAASLCSMLKKANANVEVIMTDNATKFITPVTFEALTGNRTITDTFDRNHEFSTEHISLSEKADIVCISPATANIIAKCAHGIADDMLSTTILACDCIKLIAPAMNTRMYENPVTQDNLRILKKYGWNISEPDTGRLACGDYGRGRMTEPEVIYDHIINLISAPKDMAGTKVLVTAGPTRESLDPVRFITNHSSGKMGYAIARAAAARGADVSLISGPVNLAVPVGTDIINVESALDMYNAVADRSSNHDIYIMSAAVADYTPTSYSAQKIKKKDGDLSLPLARTEDILKDLAANKLPNQTICGFAMETENVIENARKKLISKNADIIVANCANESDAGFQSDTNRITLITDDNEEALPVMSKEKCAHKILDAILKIRKK